MRKLAFIFLAAFAAILLAAFTRATEPDASEASSHREAPLISEDPTADNTDLYAFRSLDAPNSLTIISNVIPAEDPAAGPMYYRFSKSARYNIYIDRNGDAKPDVTYRFRFRNKRSPLFLANTEQAFTVTRTIGRTTMVVARGTTPPNNIGPRTTPNYRQLAQSRVFDLKGGGKVFAGQREDAFYADIGAIFDLLAFRRGTGNTGGGKDFFAGYGVHTFALQVPISQLDDGDHTVGVWTSVDRQKLTVKRVKRFVKIRRGGKLRRVAVRRTVVSRPFVQVSRLANPLVNEVIIPTTLKDRWNASSPASEKRFLRFYTSPILAKAINQLYGLNVPENNRDDLVAVLLTGVPSLNFTGPKLADLLRINLSIPPTPANRVNRLGVFGGDNAGYPNGRRLVDDVIDIAERAVAGKLKGHPAGDLLGDGVDSNDVLSLGTFPYEADPPSGYDNTKGQQKP